MHKTQRTKCNRKYHSRTDRKLKTNAYYMYMVSMVQPIFVESPNRHTHGHKACTKRYGEQDVRTALREEGRLTGARNIEHNEKTNGTATQSKDNMGDERYDTHRNWLESKGHGPRY